MFPNLVGSAIALTLGIGVAFLNYNISKYMLLHSPDKFAYSTVLRTATSIALLALVFFVGSLTPCDTTWLLCGAALGVTFPSFWLTQRLLTLNRSLLSERSKNTIKKEDSHNG